jgi:hypothetical protein
MHFHFQSGKGAAAAVVLAAALCGYAVGQETQSNAAQSNTPPGTAARGPEPSKGVPPRATPGDYQAHAQAGTVTIAAEFAGHSIPDPQSVLSTEDYVVVEVGLFGPPGANLRLSYTDFSLRINGKKAPLASQAYALVFKSLKDPDYEAPEAAAAKEAKKGNTSMTTGGTSSNAPPDSLPPIIHIPIAITRGWEARVQRSALPEGERPLPQAGLIFFEHRGKTQSIELIYNGPAGKATLPLQ